MVEATKRRDSKVLNIFWRWHTGERWSYTNVPLGWENSPSIVMIWVELVVGSEAGCRWLQLQT